MSYQCDTFVTADMANHTQGYVDYCRALMDGADKVWIERKVGMFNFISEGFGTVDFAALKRGVLDLVDLKYGTGVQVFASTPQAKYYAVCLIDTYQLKPKLIRSTIYQPRLNHVDTEEYTYDEIMQAAKMFKQGAKRVARNDAIVYDGEKGQLDLVVGQHCGFCKAKYRCSAVYDYLTTQGPLSTEGFAQILNTPTGAARDEWVNEQVGLMSAEQLGEYFVWCDLAARFARSVKEAATRRAAQGYPLENLKLVAGRSSYDWRDTERAREMLTEVGLSQDEFEPRSMISVAQAEKLTGKKFKDSPNVERSPGKATLVTDNDSRTAIDPVQDKAEAMRGF